MQSLHADLEDGIYGATLIPMHEDFSCHTEELLRHCKEMLSKGCRGIVLFGTTGEGPSFSLEERENVLKKIIEDGFDPKKLILANASASVDDTAHLIQTALKLGTRTFLIAPPSYYTGISEEGLVDFYRAIIRRVNRVEMRVILYHIPQFTGVPITLPVIQKLRKEFPGIVMGIKESEGDLSFIKAIIDECPDFKVYVGSEKQITEAACYGAAGSICGLANLYPKLICSFFERGKRHEQLPSKELEAFSKAKGNYQFIAAFKAVMENRRGSMWRVIRPPLVPLKVEQKEQLLLDLSEMERIHYRNLPVQPSFDLKVEK